MGEIEITAEPGVINSCVGEIFKNVQAPFELINSTALAAIATVLQSVIDVETPDGRISPTSLYLLIKGQSGERKSAVYNKIFESIKTTEQKEMREHTENRAIYECEKIIWDKKVQGIENKLSKLIENSSCTKKVEETLADLYGNKPQEKKYFRVLYDDVTPESLVHEMSERSKFAALVSSEGASIMGGSVFKSFTKLNSLWGGETIKVDRKSAESSLIEGGRLSICLMIQPEVLDNYLQKDAGEQRASGLWARFMIIDPPSQIGHRSSNMAPAVWEFTEKFGNRLARFMRESQRLNSAIKQRHIMRLSPEASYRFVELANSIETDSGPGRYFHRYTDHASKLAENILRVAALLQAFEFGLKEPISLNILENSINFCLAASSNFMRAFHKPSEFDKDYQALFNWLDEIRLSGRRYIRKNYILKYGPGRLRKIVKLDAVLIELQRLMNISNCLVNGVKVVDLLPWLLHIHDVAVLETKTDTKKYL